MEESTFLRRFQLLLVVSLLLSMTLTAASAAPSSAAGSRLHGVTGGRTANHLLLRRLGLEHRPREHGGGHHRKRLAAESRRLSAPGDSHVFVVKLPPQATFYDHLRPHPNDVGKVRPPVSFAANGKPASVYHWNVKQVQRARLSEAKLQHRLQQRQWKPSLSFYAPKKLTASLFQKHFAGNGKPQALYVIEKPPHHHQHHQLHPNHIPSHLP